MSTGQKIDGVWQGVAAWATPGTVDDVDAGDMPVGLEDLQHMFIGAEVVGVDGIPYGGYNADGTEIAPFLLLKTKDGQTYAWALDNRAAYGHRDDGSETGMILVSLIGNIDQKITAGATRQGGEA